MRNKEEKKNSELTVQQKIWQRIGAVLRAIRPLALYLLLPSLLVSIGWGLWGQDETLDEFSQGSGNFYMAIGIILCIVTFFLRAKKRKVTFWEDITLTYEKKQLPKLLLLVAMGMCIAVAISAVLTLIPLPEFLKSSYQEDSQAIYKGTDVLLIILCQVVLAPFAEEVVFRGYMLNRLLRVFSERFSVIAVTIVFGICHISGIWVIYALFMGYFLTKLAIREDNVLHSMALHLGFNTPAVIIFFINENEKAREAVFKSPILIAIYGITTCAGAIVLWRLYNKKES